MVCGEAEYEVTRVTCLAHLRCVSHPHLQWTRVDELAYNVEHVF